MHRYEEVCGTWQFFLPYPKVQLTLRRKAAQPLLDGFLIGLVNKTRQLIAHHIDLDKHKQDVKGLPIKVNLIHKHTGYIIASSRPIRQELNSS